MNIFKHHLTIPLALAALLAGITLFALFNSLQGCDGATCPSGQCAGNDGKCYSCSAGTYCTTNPSGNCSAPVGGVYCCAGSGGGGGCRPTGCPSNYPWKCGTKCYATPPSGNHACIKCP